MIPAKHFSRRLWVRPKGGTRYAPEFSRAIKFPAPAVQLPKTSTLKTSPGAHSATTSNGRQHTSQSVVKRWLATLVSIAVANDWPQNGHWMVANSSMRQI
jgi:hypothetical protein